MPRYVIESPGAVNVPVDDSGAVSRDAATQHHLTEKVTWLGSYVSRDQSRTFAFVTVRRPRPSLVRRTAIACR